MVPVKAVKAQPFKIQAEGGSAVNIPKPRASLAAAWLAEGKAGKAAPAGEVHVPASGSSGSCSVSFRALHVPGGVRAVPPPLVANQPSVPGGVRAVPPPPVANQPPVPGGVRAVPPPKVANQPPDVMQRPVQRPPASIGVPAAPPANMAGSHGMPCGGYHGVPARHVVVPGPPPPSPPPFPFHTLQPMPLEPPADWVGASGGYVSGASSAAVSQLPKFLLWFLLLFLLFFKHFHVNHKW